MLEAIAESRRLEEVTELNRKANSHWVTYWVCTLGAGTSAAFGAATLEGGQTDVFWAAAGATALMSFVAGAESWGLKKLVRTVRKVAHPDALARVQMGRLKHSHTRRLMVLAAAAAVGAGIGYLNSCASEEAPAAPPALSLQAPE